MNETELLEGVGLTKGEIKVYFALLELGPSTTGDIIQKAKVSRSKVYEMLNRLIDRGLVSFVIKENTKYFEAADPESVLHYIRREKSLLAEKEEALKTILPTLKKKQKFAKIPQTATVYEGIKGIKTIYSEAIYALKKGDELLLIEAEPEVVQDKEFITFLKNFHVRRVSREIKARLLACIKIKETIATNIATQAMIEIRYFEEHLPSAILIYNDNVATFVWAKNPTGIVIRSPTITSRYKKFFEDVWKTSKN